MVGPFAAALSRHLTGWWLALTMWLDSLVQCPTRRALLVQSGAEQSEAERSHAQRRCRLCSPAWRPAAAGCWPCHCCW